MSIKINNSREEDRNFIDDQIRSFNENFTGFGKENYRSAISLCIKDDHDQIIAGINGEIYFNATLHIDVLWVKEDFRQHKLGSQLINHIEYEAKKVGAINSYVETYEFQALKFYQKHGYNLYHSLDNYTGNGYKLHLLHKKL